MSKRNIRASTIWMFGAILAFSLTAVAGREAITVPDVDGFAKSLTISQLVFFRNIIDSNFFLSNN